MTDLERYRISQKKRLAVKQEVFTHYFGAAIKCNRCPEDDLRKLVMHHVDGGGSEHREAISGWATAGGSTFYAWLKKNGFPPGNYESLCSNCHIVHMYEEDRPQQRRKRGGKNRTKRREAVLLAPTLPVRMTPIIFPKFIHPQDLK